MTDSQISVDFEKLHIRGVENFYYFGVLDYVVMIEMYPKGTSYGAPNEEDEEFLRHHQP